VTGLSGQRLATEAVDAELLGLAVARFAAVDEYADERTVASCMQPLRGRVVSKPRENLR
jgi:hypothetical protein